MIGSTSDGRTNDGRTNDGRTNDSAPLQTDHKLQKYRLLRLRNVKH